MPVPVPALVGVVTAGLLAPPPAARHVGTLHRIAVVLAAGAGDDAAAVVAYRLGLSPAPPDRAPATGLPVPAVALLREVALVVPAVPVVPSGVPTPLAA